MPRRPPTRHLAAPIVVGYDGTAAASSAAAAAFDLAERTGSEVRVVTVISEQQAGGRAEAGARVALADFAAGLAAPSRERLRSEVRFGDAAAELTSAADEVSAGLIVLGATHRRGIARTLLGSTVEETLAQTLCAVLIIPGRRPTWPPRHVVIGDDASLEAELAGDIASEIAGLYGCDVTLVEAIPIDPDTEVPAAGWLASMRRVFEDRLDDRAEELAAAAGSRPAVELAVGDAIAALEVGVHGEADETLVAVGTHRRVGLDRILHSSVAHAILDHATGATLISPVSSDLLGRARAPRAAPGSQRR